MFATFVKDELPDIITLAKKSKHLLARDFTDVYSLVDKYIEKNGLITCNDSTDETSLHDYNIFAPHAFRHANNLANIISDTNIYVQLNTDIVNKEFTIFVDQIRLVHIYNIEQQFVNIMMSGRALAPEVELINIYHRLYSPNYEQDWEKLAERESMLWSELMKRRSLIVHKSRTRGGGDDDVDKVMQWLSNQSGVAIVGSRALDLLRGKKTRHRTIQVVSTDAERLVSNFKIHFNATMPGIFSKMYDAKLSRDFRLKKYVVATRSKMKVKYLINVYNSAEYELVPYQTVDGNTIATPCTQLRFLLIDLWFMRLLRWIGSINEKQYKSATNIIIDDMVVARSMWIDRDASELDQYIGVFADERIVKKNMDTPYPYYPKVYQKNKGDYRRI